MAKLNSITIKWNLVKLDSIIYQVKSNNWFEKKRKARPKYTTW